MRAILASVILSLAACSPFPLSTSTDSGIQGQVFVGPMCPVVQEGTECPDQPYETTLVILQLDGREVKRVDTDEQGRFRVPLAPGDYSLGPGTKDVMPFAAQQNFTVVPGEYTTVIYYFDSGIR